MYNTTILNGVITKVLVYLLEIRPLDKQLFSICVSSSKILPEQCFYMKLLCSSASS